MRTVHSLSSLGFVLTALVVAACSARNNPASNTKGLDGQGNPPGNPPNGNDPPDDPSSNEGSDNGPGCTVNTPGDASAVPNGWRAMAKMSDFGLEDRAPAGAWGKAELYTWGGTPTPVMGGTYLSDGGAFEPLSNAWTQLPPAPIVGRTGATQLWTPFGFFVWGGGNGATELIGGSPRAVSLKDGAIFDPCTKAWTKIPNAPLSNRGSPIAGWSEATGEVIVYGGGWASPIHELADGAAYKPSTGTWRTLAVNPFMDDFYGPATSKLVGFTGTMANGKLVVYGGVPNHAKVESDTFIVPTMYDPVTDTWTKLAPPPMTPGFFADAVTSGMVFDSASFIGRDTLHLYGEACPLGDGASFEPATNAWTYIEPEGITRTEPAAWWGAGKLWVWGGEDCSFASLASGASYDFGTKTWTPMPAGGPTSPFKMSGWWTGSEAIVWSADGGGIYRP